jgi:hypothetical protein
MEWALILLFLAVGWISATGVKSQLVRLLDVLLYGPLLIWIGQQQGEKWVRIFLYFLGATTISYNLRNYLAAGR